jgi:hypothetical protein
MITSDSVEQACNEVSDYSEQQMAEEFERFFKAQPELCDFVIELTGESDPKIQELSLFLSYMVFKTVERDRTSLPEITQTNLENAFRESEKWIEKLHGLQGNEVQSSILSGFEKENEPYLLQYVIGEINETLQDGTRLADEEKGEVFFILKTVISTFSGSGGEPQKTDIGQPSSEGIL